MSNCQFCGAEIRFRVINGNCVPIHEKSAACITQGNSGHPGECYQTSCPQCGGKVYFVRHNSGAVWFEDLGQPWDKHPCLVAERNTPEPDAALQFLLMRIRKVLRYTTHLEGASVNGFLLHLGRDRAPASAWEFFPEDGREDPHLWEGRYCYLSPSEGKLTFFNGKEFRISRSGH